jgi:hypothetical protein
MKTTFGQLAIGDRFIWHGHEYKKTETDNLPRYGWVNCRGPAFYDGDQGWRFLEDDRVVEKAES